MVFMNYIRIFDRTYVTTYDALKGEILSTIIHLFANEQQVILDRNEGWRNHPLVPSWVDTSTAGLDQFFTRPEIAQDCFESLLGLMRSDGANDQQYKFIEPSAGTGSFYDHLPTNRRTGIDIFPFRGEYINQDFLRWNPPEGSNYAIVGNPPFGYRGWLALAFVNHAATFADYLGMILPMSFQSDGKGSPKFRVKGLRLLHTDFLPADSFTDINGSPAKVNALWQVWQRGVNNLLPAQQCDCWLDLFTVDMRKERLCGQEKLPEADFFLQRTFYGSPPTLVKDFSEVRYVCGYGLIIKQDKEAIVDLLNKADWVQYSNLAAHNCRHISMYHIRKVLTDAGFMDEKTVLDQL